MDPGLPCGKAGAESWGKEGLGWGSQPHREAHGRLEGRAYDQKRRVARCGADLGLGAHSWPGGTALPEEC